MTPNWTVLYDDQTQETTILPITDIFPVEDRDGLPRFPTLDDAYIYEEWLERLLGLSTEDPTP